jgi:hypothetical protein
MTFCGWQAKLVTKGDDLFRLRLKPPHGWNAVGWELAIVTLGVLIALGAQQIAQWLNDRKVAADTRAEVTDELNSDLMSMALRHAVEPCVARRLTELRAIVTTWQKTGSFETPKWVSQSPPIEIELSRYDAALSAGRLALLRVTNSIAWAPSPHGSADSTNGNLRSVCPGGAFAHYNLVQRHSPEKTARQSAAPFRMPPPSITKSR